MSFLEAEDPDVFCIQETKAHPDQLTEELTHPLGRVPYFSISHRKGYSGTATFLKSEAEEFRYGIGIRKFDYEGRFTVTKVKGLLIYNVYFPNGASGQERHDFKQEFLHRFSNHLKRDLDSGKDVIVLGDYNVAPLEQDVYDPKALNDVSGFLPEERQWFSDFRDLGFVETFRHLHPDETDRFSWWSYRERARATNRGWRIDHICVSESLKGRIKKAEVMDQVMGSDHCPVLLELADK